MEDSTATTFTATEPIIYATPSILSYWYVFLVLLVVLVISVMFLCTCVVKRKRRNGQPSLTGTDTSVQQRNVALHSVKTSAQRSSSSVLDYRGNASPGNFSSGHTPIPSPQPSFSSSHRSGQSRYSSSLAGGQKRRRRNHSPAHTSSGSEDTIKGIQGHSLSSLTSSVATLEPQCSRLHRAESTSSGHTSRATLSRCGSHTFGHRRSTSNPSVKITALTPESPLHSTPSLLSMESGHTHKSTGSTAQCHGSMDSTKHVQIDVKVHLDQSQEMAPNQIAAALAESARQLAQSAANFEQEDDDRSTWSRSNMSSPRPSLSVLSAPHAPYQGKSRRQLFTSNSFADHHSRKPSSHTPLPMNRSVNAASMDRLPYTVSLDRPTHTISLDRPTHTISLDRPAHVSLDRPAHVVNVLNVDRHTHAANLGRTGHMQVNQVVNSEQLLRHSNGFPTTAVRLGPLPRHTHGPLFLDGYESRSDVQLTDHWSIHQSTQPHNPTSSSSANLQHMSVEPKYNIHTCSGPPTMYTSNKYGVTGSQSATNTVLHQQEQLQASHSGHALQYLTLEQSLQQHKVDSSIKAESADKTGSEVSTLESSSHQGTSYSSRSISQETPVCSSASSVEQQVEVDRCVGSPLSSHEESSSLHSRSGSGLSLEPTLGSAVSGYAATGSSSSTETISKSLRNPDNIVLPPTHLFNDNTSEQPRLVHTTHQRTTSADLSVDNTLPATSMNRVTGGNTYYTTDAVPVKKPLPPAAMPTSNSSRSSTRVEPYSLYPAHPPALYESTPRWHQEYDMAQAMDVNATGMSLEYPWTQQSRLGYAVHGPGGIVAPCAVPLHASMVPSSANYGPERLVSYVSGTRVADHSPSDIGLCGPTDMVAPPHDSSPNSQDNIASGSMTIDI